VRLWKAAKRAGHDIGRDQVARLMRQMGIEGISRLVGLVAHSDAGSQLTSVRFTERLDEIGAQQADPTGVGIK
jgi:hypothetical protein